MTKNSQSEIPSQTKVHQDSVHSTVLESPAQFDSRRIREQLDRILASSSFKTSKRHTQLLQFLVEKSIAGEAGEIKERLIGIEVFGRTPDYDLTLDPIVRGAAVELRKRIAQYYADPLHSNELRLELLPGSYVPKFYAPSPFHDEIHPDSSREISIPEDVHGPAQKAPSNPDFQLAKPKGQHSNRIRWIAAIAVTLAILAACALYNVNARSNQRMLDAFWAPLFNKSASVTVCAGDLNYLLKRAPSNDVWQTRLAASNAINPNVGNVLLDIGRILGSRGKRATLRLADFTELSDLRQQPVIFISGLNNGWTQRILVHMRFQMKSSGEGPLADIGMISDEKNQGNISYKTELFAPESSITRDFSLITRMNDSLTGQPVVLLAGLGPYGTSAAGEFVSNPDEFAQFGRTAPKGWENRNIQIVLETDVVNGKISIPRVIASQVY